jgi:hypothetical protein
VTNGGTHVDTTAIRMGVYLAGGSVQGGAQLDRLFSVLQHEAGHMACDLPERYGIRRCVRGDVVADREDRGRWERFSIHLVEARGPLSHGDDIRLVAYTGGCVEVDSSVEGAPLNVGGPRLNPRQVFTLTRKSGPGVVQPGDHIHLKSAVAGYVVAEYGGGDIVRANRETPGKWEEFIIQPDDPRTSMTDPNNKVSLKTMGLSGDYSGYPGYPGYSRYFSAEVGERTTDAEALARGWSPSDSTGSGPGGHFDVMDDNWRNLMLCGYDKIRQGWVVPKVLTPEHRASFRLKPIFDWAEALILWDPRLPEEWYVVENRRNVPGFDEVPSDGLVISWVGSHPGIGPGDFPAVISAAALGYPADVTVARPTLWPHLHNGRQDSAAAFKSGEVALPRGDGTPSRFRLRFFSDGTGDVALSIL